MFTVSPAVYWNQDVTLTWSGAAAGTSAISQYDIEQCTSTDGSNQSDFNERNNGYLDRHRQATERVDELEAMKRNRIAKSKTLDAFIRDIEKRPLALAEWDEALWLAVIDQVMVSTDSTMTFQFRNGSEITA